MSTENELELKIDAVITWVDGNDLNWQKKINKYLKVKKDFSKMIFCLGTRLWFCLTKSTALSPSPSQNSPSKLLTRTIASNTNLSPLCFTLASKTKRNYKLPIIKY
jgi:hypothetical protein